MMDRDPIEELLATAEEPMVPARDGLADELIDELRHRYGTSRPPCAVVDLPVASVPPARGATIRWVAAVLILVAASGIALSLAIGGDAEPAARFDCQAVRAATNDLAVLVDQGPGTPERSELEALRDALDAFDSDRETDRRAVADPAVLTRISGLTAQAILQLDAGDPETATRTMIAARATFQRASFCR